MCNALDREGLEVVLADKRALADVLEQPRPFCLREQLHNYLDPGSVWRVCAGDEQQL